MVSHQSPAMSKRMSTSYQSARSTHQAPSSASLPDEHNERENLMAPSKGRPNNFRTLRPKPPSADTLAIPCTTQRLPVPASPVSTHSPYRDDDSWRRPNILSARHESSECLRYDEAEMNLCRNTYLGASHTRTPGNSSSEILSDGLHLVGTSACRGQTHGSTNEAASSSENLPLTLCSSDVDVPPLSLWYPFPFVLSPLSRPPKSLPPSLNQRTVQRPVMPLCLQNEQNEEHHMDIGFKKNDTILPDLPLTAFINMPPHGRTARRERMRVAARRYYLSLPVQTHKFA